MAQPLVLANVHIIDAVTPPAREGSVVVEDGRIVEVLSGSQAHPTQNARVLDLGGAYLLPGLWDVHTHLGWGNVSQETLWGESIVDRALRAGRMAKDALAVGITGLRSLGERAFIDISWKRAFDSGQHTGPRLVTSGHFLTTTAGHFLRSMTAIECDGPAAFRQAVREQIKAGADFIKLNLSGGIMGASWDRWDRVFPTPDEIQAVFEVAHQRDFPVAAHATNPEAVKLAVRYGARSVEHGYILDDEAITLMAQNGTYFVPTLTISQVLTDLATDEYERAFAAQRNLPPDLYQRAMRAADGHADGVRKAIKAGERFACGSDVQPVSEGGRLEPAQLVKLGMDPWDAILASTRNAADLCNRGHELGTVEVGKLADLLVVSANPLEQITNLRKTLLVVKGGEIVADYRKR